VFTPGVTTRPALAIVDFFKGFACADVVVKLPVIRSGVIDSAKILKAFEGNILGRFSISIFPLFRGDVLKRMLALPRPHKEFCEGNLLSPHI
jgi:hypothetical protein